MAIIAEAISVIVKDDSIQEKYNGGLKRFYNDIPNKTHCSDGKIHRIGFMNPDDTQSYVRLLELNGLKFISNDEFIDIAVVDMIHGSTKKCIWLGFERNKFFSGQHQYKKSEEEFSIVWLLENIEDYGKPVGSNRELQIITPPNWTPDRAIYGSDFIPIEKYNSRLIELENEDGVSKLWDAKSGDMVFIAKKSDRNGIYKCKSIDNDTLLTHEEIDNKILDENKSYRLIWKRHNKFSKLSLYLNVKEDFIIPYFIDGEERKLFDKSISSDLSEFHLLRGILIGLSFNIPSPNKLNESMLISILPILQDGFKFRSMEQMILDVAFNLEKKNSYYSAYKALKGGLKIESESSMIRSDLIINIWKMWEENPDYGYNFIDDVIENFYKIDLNGILPDAIEMVVYTAFIAIYFKKSDDTSEFLHKYCFKYISRNKIKERIKYLLENKDLTLKDVFWK